MEWTSDGQGHFLQSVQVAIGDGHVNHVRLPLAQDCHWSRTAWDFHPQAGPTLILDWNYTPTPDFGVFVKQMLAGSLPRYTPPAAPTK